jgi:lipopolysaccharide/colanic/teichoic acid biosynthesis glycosyltransferase
MGTSPAGHLMPAMHASKVIDRASGTRTTERSHEGSMIGHDHDLHAGAPSAWLRVRMAFLDQVAAVVLGILSLPLVGVIALAIRREDGKPAFVRVERMGAHQRPFGMWKLRSMRTDRADGHAGGAALTADNDPRITRVGARLRAFHLDELPQLLNVVRGEMLLLGPRPEDPRFVDPGSPEWCTVLEVPPGIAGPTQMIVGDWERHHIADDPEGDAYPTIVVPAKLAIDQWYVTDATPWLDLLTLIALVKRFLPRSGATRMKRRAFRALPDVVGRILADEAAYRQTTVHGLRRSA